MPKRNAMKNPGEDLADQLDGLREQLTAMEGKVAALPKSNPRKNPLSADAIDRLHEAHREGGVDLADVLDQLCQDPDCPDIEPEQDQE